MEKKTQESSISSNDKLLNQFTAGTDNIEELPPEKQKEFRELLCKFLMDFP